MKALGFILMAMAACAAHAQSREFSPPLSVVHTPASKVFYHLESSGSKNIAVGGDTVAVVWEDNRSGKPEIYAAIKPNAASRFSDGFKLSGGADAAEPAIAVAGTDFVAVWEEGGAVWLRRFDADGKTTGAALKLAEHAAQASVAADMKYLYAAWSAQRKPVPRIEWLRLEHAHADETSIRRVKPRAVTATVTGAGQFYPSLTLASDGALHIAFEDRRAGHTRIYAARSAKGAAFAAAQPVNESTRGSAVFGKGSGAARPALAPYRAGVAAVWLDKRNFQSGYDIFAAWAQPGRFGVNEKVQDDFGENVSQWHPALATHGDIWIALWDDDRDETADVFLAQRGAQGWDENIAVANGPAAQHSPSAAFDRGGGLHIVWVEQSTDGASGIYYRYSPPIK